MKSAEQIDREEKERYAAIQARFERKYGAPATVKEREQRLKDARDRAQELLSEFKCAPVVTTREDPNTKREIITGIYPSKKACCRELLLKIIHLNRRIAVGTARIATREEAIECLSKVVKPVADGPVLSAHNKRVKSQALKRKIAEKANVRYLESLRKSLRCIVRRADNRGFESIAEAVKTLATSRYIINKQIEAGDWIEMTYDQYQRFKGAE